MHVTYVATVFNTTIYLGANTVLIEVLIQVHSKQTYFKDTTSLPP